jgi:RimJ/RimL family protein N-acetyltransferase
MIAKSHLGKEWLIETERLCIRPAIVDQDDIEFLVQLWNTPEVMRYVGFPFGLKTTFSKVESQLKKYGTGVFDRVLLICLKATNETIGECELGSPNQDGIAHTDIKLGPKYWGSGFGKETKFALVDYLFNQTTCTGIRATPNKLNIASIKMQEAVGGRPINEDCYKFPSEMKEYAQDVEFIEYVVSRSDWKRPVK